MSTEPDNDSNAPRDRLLKSYAQQRREKLDKLGPPGEPARLHPATRRLLQDEVHRQYGPQSVHAKADGAQPGRSDSGGGTIGLLWRWRSLAFALGTVTVLATLVWIAFRNSETGSETLRLAKQDAVLDRSATQPQPRLKAEEREATPSVAAAPPLVPAAPAPLSTESRPDGGKPDAGKPFTLAKKAEAAPQDAPTTQPTPFFDAKAKEARTAAPGLTLADQAKPARALAATELQRENRPLNQTPAGPAADLARNETGTLRLRALQVQQQPAVASNDDYSNTARRSYFRATARQNYARPLPPQTTPAATSVSQAAEVLNQFALEQSGDQVRLIDADGSVYAGYVYNAGTPAAAGQTQTQPQAQPTPTPAQTLTPAGLPAAQNQAGALSGDGYGQQARNGVSVLNFRVQGTNRTLQEPVELDGILMPVISTQAGEAANEPAPASSSTVSATPTLGGAPSTRQAARSAFTEKRAEDALSVSRFAVSQSGASPGGTARTQARGLGLTNFSSIQRIQGNLRVGATNRLQVDAFRSAP